jgi:hypothetical protein
MLIISHRGNLFGPSENENNPKFIDDCINSNFDCEVDLWYQNSSLKLGHDSGVYEIDINWLAERKDFLWVHCKNSAAINILKNDNKIDFNYFWHDKDSYTMTASGKIWVYPGMELIPGCVAVLPEKWHSVDKKNELLKSFAVCTDYPYDFKNILG